MWKMDPRSGCNIRLVFTLPPRDSTLQYKRCVYFWNNFLYQSRYYSILLVGLQLTRQKYKSVQEHFTINVNPDTINVLQSMSIRSPDTIYLNQCFTINVNPDTIYLYQFPISRLQIKFSRRNYKFCIVLYINVVRLIILQVWRSYLQT